MSSSAALRLQNPAQRFEDPLAALERSSRRLAAVVEAVSRRRDVRRLRALLVLFLVEHRCPLGEKPRTSWYVPGAVARMGAPGICRAWKSWCGEEPPSERTVRRHLGELERACALVRSPGDRIPIWDPERPERRPRYPDTLHVLDSEDDARFWARLGLPELAACPRLRQSPEAWRERFGSWRERRELCLQLELFPEEPALPAAQDRERHERDVARSRTIRRAVLQAREAHELIERLAGAGVRPAGQTVGLMLQDPKRLRAAAALLALVLARPDPRHRVRNAAGWLTSAFRSAERQELERALWQVRREARARPDPAPRDRR